MKREIGEVLVALFQKLGFRSFLGGSTRFAAETPSSDIDVCVLVLPKDIDNFETLMYRNGFKTDQQESYPESLYQWGQIHIIRYDVTQIFEADSRFHTLIEVFLNANPDYRSLIMDMKRDGIKGKQIFNYFTKIAAFHNLPKLEQKQE